MGAFWTAFANNLTGIVLLLPLLGAGMVWACARRGVATIRRIVGISVTVTCLLSLLLVGLFDAGLSSTPNSEQPMQMVTSVRWLGEALEPQSDAVTANGHEGQSLPRGAERAAIGGPDVRLAVGVDGISIWFVVLTAVLMIPAVAAGGEVDARQPVLFYGLLLSLEASLIGVFTALDVVLFVICLELSTLLVFFLIGIWGGHDRRRIARKFLAFHLAGGLLILLGLLGVVVGHAMLTASSSHGGSLTFSIPRLLREIPEASAYGEGGAKYWGQAGGWMFLALLTGFAVKMPVFPFHVWMPEANLEAPTSVSLVMSGAALKVGGYGFARFLLPLFSEMLAESSGFLIGLAGCGIVYTGLLTLAQDDVKKMGTYAGLVQIGTGAAALISFSAAGVAGGLLCLLSHGLAAGMLFYLVGILDRQYRTRDSEAFSGLARKFPRLGWCLALSVLALVGAPGLSGFPAQWLSLAGLFQISHAGALGALAGWLFVACAFLWLLQRMLSGRPREPLLAAPSDSRPRDLHKREVAALAPLVAMMLWMAFCPRFFTSRMEGSIIRLINPLALSDHRLQ